MEIICREWSIKKGSSCWYWWLISDGGSPVAGMLLTRVLVATP